MDKNLIQTFKIPKKILKKYENPLIPGWDLDSKYDFWSIKNIEIAGRKGKEIYFTDLIIESNYMGFYFMPIYSDTPLKKIFSPDLLKLLKGKSCFHIKKLDKNLEKQINEALKIGYKLYKKKRMDLTN